ncbi:YybH family protein [Saccharopolyspora erythraea]|uniref:YybH family protein n=1 Tax=Saccharopolyspora erythraea TaxID=1836 RepID=UPI0022B224E7|nr:nuclear transport factor 2 family protein [Saccharopolyspora erythraea]
MTRVGRRVARTAHSLGGPRPPGSARSGLKAQQADDTARVRELVERWARAVRDRDLDGILAHHSPDLVFYDVPEPVRFRGLEAYRRSWEEEFFPWFGDSGLFELDELGGHRGR